MEKQRQFQRKIRMVHLDIQADAECMPNPAKEEKACYKALRLPGGKVAQNRQGYYKRRRKVG